MLPSFRFQFLSLVLLLTTPATSRLSQARVSGRGNNTPEWWNWQTPGTCLDYSIGRVAAQAEDYEGKPSSLTFEKARLER